MKNKKSERGQSLVEFAISLTILLYLLSGAVEFGILFFQYVQLRDAAQEGALFGSTHPADLANIETRARSSSGVSPIDLSPTAANPATVEIFVDDTLVRVNGADTGAYSATTACEAHALEVRVSFDHQVFMPFVPALIGDKIPLNASVTDTILTPVCPSP